MRVVYVYVHESMCVCVCIYIVHICDMCVCVRACARYRFFEIMLDISCKKKNLILFAVLRYQGNLLTYSMAQSPS